MKIIQTKQGSPEWLELRKGYHTASQASVAAGLSPHQKRSDLLQAKKTGVWPSSPSSFIMERGHDAEAVARQEIEREYGDDFLPIVVASDDGRFLASLDGFSVLEDMVFEHKLWNKDKAAYIQEYDRVPECDYWQCVQQLYITRAAKLLYVLSDNQNRITTEMLPDDEDFQQLLGIWEQFDKDVEAYTPLVETVLELPVLKRPEPSGLVIEAVGQIVKSNLPAFRAEVEMAIGSINQLLNTEQDFAQAEQDVKWLSSVETTLGDLAKNIVKQTVDISEAIATLETLAKQSRTTRLHIEKLTKIRKDEIRREIMSEAKAKWDAYQREANEQVGRPIPLDAPDIERAMKGKKTQASLRESADTAVVQAIVASRPIVSNAAKTLAIVNRYSKGVQGRFLVSHSLKTASETVANICDGFASEEQAEQAEQTKPLVQAEQTKPLVQAEQVEDGEQAYPGHQAFIEGVARQFNISRSKATRWVKTASQYII